MNKAVENAKAVLANAQQNGVQTWPDDGGIVAALAAMIEENERLTTPLDADEGRELVEKSSLYIEPIRAGSYNVESNEEAEGLYLTAEWIEKAADLIERQAARIAALTAIPEEVEGLCKRLDYLGACADFCEGRCEWCPDIVGKEAAAALRAYAAREAKLRRGVEAMADNQYEKDFAARVLALIDQQDTEQG